MGAAGSDRSTSARWPSASGAESTVKTLGKATAQLKEKGYVGKYRHLGQPIRLVGVEFSREERNVAVFSVEPA